MSQENESARRSRSRLSEDILIKDSPSKAVAVPDPMAGIVSSLMNCDAARLRLVFDTTIKEHNRLVIEEKETYSKELEDLTSVTRKTQTEIDKLYTRIEELSKIIEAQDIQEALINDNHASNMHLLEERQIKIKNMMQLFAAQLDGFTD